MDWGQIGAGASGRSDGQRVGRRKRGAARRRRSHGLYTFVVLAVGMVIRRPDEISILHLLEKLGREAASAGGAVHVIHGNHETMTSIGDFRYADRAALDNVFKWHSWQCVGHRLKVRMGCVRRDSSSRLTQPCPCLFPSLSFALPSTRSTLSTTPPSPAFPRPPNPRARTPLAPVGRSRSAFLPSRMWRCK